MSVVKPALSAASSEPVLEVSGVAKSFRSIRALAGVDLRVPRGRVFGLVGPNGAGKTTLFAVVCGFLQADAGKVLVDGTEVMPRRPPPSGKVSLLPQDARFLSGVSVGRQLAYYARLMGLTRAKAKQDVRRVLALVGLAEVISRRPGTLSHGMLKRVGVAQAFLGNPELVILDEPTAGLDPHAARDVRALLRTLRGNRSVIVSSHNLAEVEDLCHEVAILHEGRVVRHDTLAALLSKAAEVSLRLADPPGPRLMEAVEMLDFVDDAVWDATNDRLRVHFDPDAVRPDVAGRDVVTLMVEREIPFLDLQIGATLEDRFVEETGAGAS
jgi:ABC-2 type transport system ATP-binding protein